MHCKLQKSGQREGLAASHIELRQELGGSLAQQQDLAVPLPARAGSSPSGLKP